MKILIAEDDIPTNKLYKAIFSKDELTICVTAEDFIMEYSDKYDAFIVDLCLPIKSGYEVLNFLNSVNGHKPVVVASASLFDRDWLRNPNQNITFLMKPFKIKDLKSAINHV